MRLIDQGRHELKELQVSSANKVSALTQELHSDKQLIVKQKHEMQSLEFALSEAQESIGTLKKEYQGLQIQLETKMSESNDLAELKTSILALQGQLLKS